MARAQDQVGSPQTTTSDQRRAAPDSRAPKDRAVVLTPEGLHRLAARAAWLRTERVPELARDLDDPDQNGWADGEHGQALAELAHLTSILGQAVTTDQAPENPDIVELGDEVVVEFPDGDTERFLIVDPVEAPLDEFRISIESPLSQALLGRRVGEQVDVEAPAGRYRCLIVTACRLRAAAP